MSQKEIKSRNYNKFIYFMKKCNSQENQENCMKVLYERLSMNNCKNPNNCHSNASLAAVVSKLY